MSEKIMKRITVKIGTRVLTDKNNRIDQNVLGDIAGQIADIMDSGTEVILVSSGAVGSGLGILGLDKNAISLSAMQAAASIGQNYLMNSYNEHFSKRKYVTGQMLLTQEDLTDRKRFLNIKYTLNTLLKHKALPVINENDSVSTDEIKCGDNDRLSSLVADLADSDILIILTDVEGLYDENGKVVKVVQEINENVRSLCRGKGSTESTGGMITKLDAAQNVVKSGIQCVIASGRKKNVLKDICSGRDIGTKFVPLERTLKARKRWIAFSLKAKGAIIVDEGAEKALIDGRKSLLPIGIKDVKGIFSEGDVVEISSASGTIIARGLSNYSSDEVVKIKGKKTNVIEKELGYKDYDEVVHRDNLVIVEEE
ncbi:MAG: glutamate 5-kinase [Candidatus Aadella gelida]|nr:glutamate 5-kinase [Candidatus Aadella gelida]